MNQTPSSRSSEDEVPNSFTSPSDSGNQELETRHRPGSFKELFYVSLPLIISAGSHSLMNVADRVMLAGYSPSSADGTTALDIIAAVTPAGMMYWSFACIPLGTILYANTFISQFDGAGKPRELASAFWQAVWLAVVTGALLLGSIPIARSLFELAGHSPSVIRQEMIYFNTLCWGAVFQLMSNALGCYYSGRQATSVLMKVTLSSVVINVFVDYGLIFGHWGLPELGIKGAAIATVFARICEVVVYTVLIYRHCRGNYPLAETWKPNTALLKKYLRYGFPSGLHYFIDNSSFLIFLLIVGSLNRDVMAATNLAFSVNSIIFVPLLGFGTAVQTLVGHHIGAGIKAAASQTTWNAIRMATVWTGGAAILLVFFPGISLLPFLAFEETPVDGVQSVRSVLPVAAGLLKFVAIYSIFDAMAVVFASALRGAGDTVFPMMITMFSGWLVMTIPAWLIVQMNGATIEMLWMTCTGHITLMGTAMLLRFMSGKWKLIKLT